MHPELTVIGGRTNVAPNVTVGVSKATVGTAIVVWVGIHRSTVSVGTCFEGEPNEFFKLILTDAIVSWRRLNLSFSPLSPNLECVFKSVSVS